MKNLVCLKGFFVLIALTCFTASGFAQPAVFDSPRRIAELTSRESDSLEERAYEFADKIFKDARVVHYEHLHQPAREQVQSKDGNLVSRNDCSGFISYVLFNIAPKHYHPIREMQPDRNYPQAKTFARFFQRLSAEESHDGWIGVRSFRDLRRGDIIAWEKGQTSTNHSGKGNSGHVMMVRDTPRKLESVIYEGRQLVMVSVPVLDSSSVYHFPPEELPPSAEQSHRDGLGKGDIKLVVDEQGRPIGYWEGTYWGEGQKDVRKPSFSEIIGFGRMIPFGN
jgi:hypothetical protein